MKKIRIAIDGPAGSGKSVVGQEVAKKIGYQFIDTGLIYRAFTYFCLQDNIDFTDLDSIKEQLKKFDCHFNRDKIFINNADVTKNLFTSEIIANINIISSLTIVRQYLTIILQKQVKNKGIVMIGRDITSVILPDAELKIYLTASLSIRTKRRWEQEKKIKTLLEVQKEIKKRDINDTQRKEGPLVITPDAIILDNSNITLEQTVLQILNYVKVKVGDL